jgi:hypothetical protein
MESCVGLKWLSNFPEARENEAAGAADAAA